MTYRDFTDMPVWNSAFALTLETYRVTKVFPVDERFGLISDMRRAANSITHNIAEGYGRYEARDKTRFYKIARGSAYELISQLMVAHGLSYLRNQSKETLIESSRSIISELNAIIKTLETKRGRGEGEG